MKTFEITYAYNYQAEQSKIFKASDGLDAIEALKAWAQIKKAAINKVKLQEIHLGHLSNEGRVSHTYGNTLVDWKFKKITIDLAIEIATQKWIESKKNESE